jgi:hypothetical protein
MMMMVAVSVWKVKKRGAAEGQLKTNCRTSMSDSCPFNCSYLFFMADKGFGCKSILIQEHQQASTTSIGICKRSTSETPASMMDSTNHQPPQKRIRMEERRKAVTLIVVLDSAWRFFWRKAIILVLDCTWRFFWQEAIIPVKLPDQCGGDAAIMFIGLFLFSISSIVSIFLSFYIFLYLSISFYPSIHIYPSSIYLVST